LARARAPASKFGAFVDLMICLRGTILFEIEIARQVRRSPRAWPKHFAPSPGPYRRTPPRALPAARAAGRRTDSVHEVRARAAAAARRRRA
jgi:hypothetical protein